MKGKSKTLNASVLRVYFKNPKIQNSVKTGHSCFITSKKKILVRPFAGTITEVRLYSPQRVQGRRVTSCVIPHSFN